MKPLTSAIPKVFCLHTSITDLYSLKPFPKNPNKHPDSQIQLLAGIIQEHGWRSSIVISKRSGYITKGHGRLEAAKLLFEATGSSLVPVEYQDYASEAEEIEDIVADNRIAELSYLDLGMVKDLVIDMPDLDFANLGYDFDFTANIPSSGVAPGANTQPDADKNKETIYSRKVGTPVYTPTKPEAPALTECYSISRAQELIEKIEASSASDSLKNFLIAAAYRHTVFNYGEIAELYAHASAEEQRLMEDSALVIVDFAKAIESGYVTMSEEIRQQYLQDSSNSDP